MRIALFPGSFNPIHLGHLIIAEYLANHFPLDAVWFMISPQNPLKRKSLLQDARHRVEMVQLAIEGNDRFTCSAIELGMPQPSYTIDTVDTLKIQYPGNHFSLLLGEDSFRNLSKWKAHDRLMAENVLYVYPRKGEHSVPTPESLNSWPASIQFLDQAPIIDLSSTSIRASLKNAQTVKYQVPESVIAYIAQYQLY